MFFCHFGAVGFVVALPVGLDFFEFRLRFLDLVAVAGGSVIEPVFQRLLLLGLEVGDFVLGFEERRRHVHVLDVDAGSGLVECVDGLVGQTAVGDVAGGEGNARLDGFVGVAYVVVILVFVFDVVQDFNGLFGGGGFEQNLLEAAFQSAVLFDVLAVLVEGGGTDALQFAAGEGGFEHIGGVEAAG